MQEFEINMFVIQVATSLFFIEKSWTASRGFCWNKPSRFNSKNSCVNMKTYAESKGQIGRRSSYWPALKHSLVEVYKDGQERVRVSGFRVPLFAFPSGPKSCSRNTSSYIKGPIGRKKMSFCVLAEKTFNPLRWKWICLTTYLAELRIIGLDVRWLKPQILGHQITSVGQGWTLP